MNVISIVTFTHRTWR